MSHTDNNFDEFENDSEFGGFEDKAPTKEEDEAASKVHAIRRGLLEKALTSVKSAQKSPFDIQKSYKKGTLIFDSVAKQFGRVVSATATGFKLRLGSGKELAYGTSGKTSSSKTSLKTVSKSKSLPIKAGTASEAVFSTSLEKPKATRKASAKTKKAVAKKTKGTSVTLTAPALPPGATTDPVADPNGYIQQNYAMMSNKEMATITGLSEHTIRRKLGEWGLKRVRSKKKA